MRKTVRIWTLANILSLLRIVIVIPVAYFLYRDQPGDHLYVITGVLLAALTDFLDGVVARSMNQISDLGKIIDPVADKFGVAAVGVVLMLQGKIPIWFVALVLIRDLLLLLGGAVFFRKKQVVLQSTWTGKWTVGLLGLIFLMAILDLDAVRPVMGGLFGAGALMLVLSFILYVRRYLAISRQAGASFQSNP